MLKDGRFAIFGGITNRQEHVASCDVLSLDGGVERWESLPPMRQARANFACQSIGGGVIVAGGRGSITAEVYEEALGRWRRLPCVLPYDYQIYEMASAVL